jgi:DNA-binding CsgD family transcriptional regulator
MVGGMARARESYRNRGWKAACEGFLAEQGGLGSDDLERLAVSAFLVGRNAESDRAWERAHRRHLAEGNAGAAIRCAFWLAFRLVNVGDQPQGNAWIARLERLVSAAPGDSLAQARSDYLTGLRAALDGRLDAAVGDLGRAAALATDEGDEELAALARLSLARVRIFLGQIPLGVRLLDDAMLVVGSEPISPIAVGDSYCTAIAACHDLYDVRRGQAWTDGLSRWCGQQADLVPFVGVCQVHCSEFLQLRGSWAEAIAQARLARERLARPSRQLAYGAAVYQQGELHRLLGQSEQAEACYRDASAAGRDPQPGLAMLRLRQGRAADAAHAMDRALSETGDSVARTALLGASVEIMLAVGRVAEAEAAASELADLATALESPLLGATARRAAGWVRLAGDHARDALADLRGASDGFRELEAPYEVARTALLIGTARTALGDVEGAGLEFDTARTTFERLGARPDLALVPGRPGSGLTARELQVLRLVTQGATNRTIGTALGLSQRTVDHHVSHIFTKLGVSSRAAATALAYQSGLIGGPSASAPPTASRPGDGGTHEIRPGRRGRASAAGPRRDPPPGPRRPA